ncbi:O-antigen ligase family protein [Rodentibacter genomosp. 2]|uniref:Polymerase n=1 Tax=Rodentibacter genomosp. 2 TaxID=1908266 RepID=A0A1V3JIK6_9PAST|nr:O-antigen ligase family protein [Rodentibacter genomosp. 2]OOF56408.1 polymerase [Rodentibacter genomosp. 2]
MAIQRTDIFKLVLLFGLALTVLSPALSNLAGLPRLDSALGGLFVTLSIITLFSNKIETDFLKFLLPLYGVFFFGFLSVLASFFSEKLVDLFFFGIVIFSFHYSFLAFRHRNGENDIRYLLLGISLFVLLGFFIEAGLGIQLVSGNEELTVTDKAFKGFFFNTNDQAVVMVSLAAAVGFFFIIRGENLKLKVVGYTLLLMMGAVVVVSASRSVLASYLMMLILLLFLNASLYFRVVYLLLGCVIILFIFNLSWLQEIFLQLSRIEWLERPIERFSLVIFSMNDDKSVGYRTEIYGTFIDNFKILWLGYGPRDYIHYFDQVKLSFPLGYTNPHSFFIEVYLAFGIFAFISFIYFLFYLAFYVLNDGILMSKEKIFILFIIANFCWIVWVPSSIFRLPLVWYPLFWVLIDIILNKHDMFSKNNR